MTALPINRREKWLAVPPAPQVRLRAANPMCGMGVPIREYLAAFGPATPEEISAWTRLPLASVVTCLESLKRHHTVKLVASGKPGKGGRHGAWALRCWKNDPALRRG